MINFESGQKLVNLYALYRLLKTLRGDRLRPFGKKLRLPGKMRPSVKKGVGHSFYPPKSDRPELLYHSLIGQSI